MKFYLIVLISFFLVELHAQQNEEVLINNVSDQLCKKFKENNEDNIIPDVFDKNLTASEKEIFLDVENETIKKLLKITYNQQTHKIKGELWYKCYDNFIKTCPTYQLIFTQGKTIPASNKIANSISEETCACITQNSNAEITTLLEKNMSSPQIRSLFLDCSSKSLMNNQEQLLKLEASEREDIVKNSPFLTKKYLFTECPLIVRSQSKKRLGFMIEYLFPQQYDAIKY